MSHFKYVIVLFLAAFEVLGSPMQSERYLPIAICNNHEISLFQTYLNGVSTQAGIFTAQTEEQPLSLTPISKVSGSRAAGYSISFESDDSVFINPDGSGQWAHLQCKQDDSVVRCERVKTPLMCSFPPAAPGGFSAGH